MRKTSIVGVLLALAMATHGWKAQAATTVMRAIGDARAWSILPGDSRTLTWRWSEGATVATLLATNVVTGVGGTSAEVVRGEARDASAEIPLAGVGLFDVTLRETAGEVVVHSQTVRLKVGQPRQTVALDKAAGEFRLLDEPRPYSWDVAWFAPAAETATLSTATKDGTMLGTWTLPGRSGFGVLGPRSHFAGRSGRASVALAIDGEEVAMANLYLPSGLMLYLR